MKYLRLAFAGFLASFYLLAFAVPVLAQNIDQCINGDLSTDFGCNASMTAIRNLCANPSTMYITGDPDTLGKCPAPSIYVLKGQTIAQAQKPSKPLPVPPVPNPNPNPTPNPTPNPAPGGGGSGNLPVCVDDKSGLCLPENPVCNKSSSNTSIACGTPNVTSILTSVIKDLLYFAGIIAVVFMIIGGYRYMTSAGSEEGAKKGRATLTNAVIGLVVIILAYVIVLTITNFLTK